MDIEGNRLRERLKLVRDKLNKTGYAAEISKRRGNNGNNMRALVAEETLANNNTKYEDPVDLMYKTNLAAGNNILTNKDDDLAGGVISGGSFWSSLGKIARVGSSVLGMVPSGRAQIGSTALGAVAGLTGQGKKKGRPRKNKVSPKKEVKVEPKAEPKADNKTAGGNKKAVVSHLKKGAVMEPIEGGALILGGKKTSKTGKPKRKVSDKMLRRGALVKKLMKAEGLSFAEASRAVKQRNLKY